MQKTAIVTVFIGMLFVSNAIADQNYFKTVDVNGISNCAIYGKSKWDAKSVKVELPKGKYILKPVSGAISPWPKDSTAYQAGEKPWMWYLFIDVDTKKYVMGKLIKFDTKEEALKENQDDEIAIELVKET
jgi:hypothetical protein